MITVPDFLSHIRIATPQVAHNLTVFPLIDDRPVATEDPGYATLNQALADGSLRIEEVSRHGSVPELKVKNKSAKPVLLLDGEELVGAKQNRVPNVTILVPEKATIIIPVSCVEAGRWAYSSSRFKTSERAHFSSGRAAKQAFVSDSLAARGTRRSDQSRVWADIDEMLYSTNTHSNTRAMADVYKSHRKRLEDYVSGVRAQHRQVGAIFAIGERIQGMELFGRTATLANLLPKLVRSFALDALRSADRVCGQPTAGAAQAFLAPLKSQGWKIYDAVGIGNELRLNTEEIVASGLLYSDELVHLVAFRTPTQSRGAEDSGLSQSTKRQGLMKWWRRRANG